VVEKHVDVIEGFNARLHDPELNERAADWATLRRLPLGAGSDAHTLAEVGRAYVTLEAFADEPRALVEALRRGTISGRTSPRRVHVHSTVAKLRKRFRKR
jgi:predicted metal-dependent phosphoesterase TrpH